MSEKHLVQGVIYLQHHEVDSICCKAGLHELGYAAVLQQPQLHGRALARRRLTLLVLILPWLLPHALEGSCHL